jgi:hypothetical protein
MFIFSIGHDLARSNLAIGLLACIGVLSPQAALSGDVFEPDNTVFSAAVINDDDSVITGCGTGTWSQVHTLHIAGDEDWVIIRPNANCGIGSVVSGSYELEVKELVPINVLGVLALYVRVYDQTRLFDASVAPVEEFNSCGPFHQPFPGIPVTTNFSVGRDELVLLRVKNCFAVDRPDSDYRIRLDLLTQLNPFDPGLISGRVLEASSLTPIPFIFVVTNFASATFSAPVTGDYKISQTTNDNDDPLILSIISDVYEADDINLGVLLSTSKVDQDILVRIMDQMFTDGFE